MSGLYNSPLRIPELEIFMVKADLVKIIAREARITKVSAESAVNAIIDALKNALAQGERIELRGFGVFEVRPRKRGIGRNPRTGQEIVIPPGKSTRFRPGKNLGKIG
ncbi:MAG TPA: HU family DNA-binding protein [Acidobacteriota bacterium]|jgi:DNA-binding protein HU-beta|nr:HU family DNA-binding protein [Acidobacteriota bacterium]|tara:strand:+ start:696 stop:1016 length:321 start_codon:yes stop_codon:yes gene_type:complete